MKTKTLLTTGALVTLLAACSNEFETPVANDSVNEMNRPSAGNVVIKANVVENDEDASTRATWTGGGWLFNEEGDRFGAMLMDTWNQSNEGHTTIADYTFTDYIHTNIPFHSEDKGETWQSPENAAVCEGNYFFYYPYDPTYKTRGYVNYVLENNQSNVDENGEADWGIAIKENQRYLGYAFVPAAAKDLNVVDVDFYPLFATPKFKLQNVSGMDLRLIKLIIRTHQSAPVVTPALMPNKVALAPLSKGMAEVNKQYPTMEEKEQIASLFSHATLVQNGFFAQKPVAGSKIESKDDEGVYEYTVDFGDKYIVSAGEFFKGCVVMPAGQYFDFDVFALIEEQNSEKTTGVVSLSSLKTASWSGFDSQNGAIQTVLKPGVLQVFSANFDSEALQNLSLENFTVASTEDLAWIIDLKAKFGGKDRVVIKTLGDQVTMDEKVYNLISAENRKGIKWVIDGIINIPATAKEDAIDQLTTGEQYNPAAPIKTTIINKGNQKVEKDLVNCDVLNYGTLIGDITIYGDVKNAEGANLTVTAIKGNILENVGNITVKTVTGDVENGYNATIETVAGNINNYDNGGLLTINNVEGTLTNTGFVVAKGGTLANVTNGSSISNSTINIEDKTTINYLYNEKWGKINVNADSKMAGSNYGIINVNQDVTLTPIGKGDNALVNAQYKDKFGVINVTNGTLKFTDASSTIQNDGYIFVIEKSYVAINQGKGIIDITAATDGYQTSCQDESVFFRYRGAVDTEKLQKLIAAGNYGKNPVILDFETSAEQTANMEGAKIRKIVVRKGATLTLEGKYWLDNDHTNYEYFDALGDSHYALEVEEGATLQVLNGKTLEAGSSFNAIINGTFNVKNNASVKVAQGEVVTIKGTGTVFASQVAAFDWNKDAAFGDNWTVKY